MGCQNIEDLEAILRNLLMRYGSVTAKILMQGNGRFWNCSAGSASKKWPRQFEMEKQIVP